MNKGNGSWTEARLALLPVLRAQGVSCSQIAMRLNALPGPVLTRNAVIGKAQRMGFLTPARPCAPGLRYDGTPARRPPPRPVQVRGLPPSNGHAPRVLMIDRPKPVEPSPAGAKPLIELRPRDCRWIVAGSSEGAMFCASPADEGYPYCPYHRSVAYEPPKPGRSSDELIRANRRFMG